jgi:hypothetical protein
MFRVEVVNIYHILNTTIEDALTTKYIYIGRENYKLKLEGSCLANPYPLSRYSRENSLALYKVYLDKQLENINSPQYREIQRLKEILISYNIKLVCYCVPKECHGHYIKEVIERI